LLDNKSESDIRLDQREEVIVLPEPVKGLFWPLWRAGIGSGFEDANIRQMSKNGKWASKLPELLEMFGK